MSARRLLLLAALTACKPAQVGIDGACEDDLGCLPDLYCRAGLRPHNA